MHFSVILTINHKYTPYIIITYYKGELLQTFYQGMTFENKHLMNSSSGGQFSRMRVNIE